MRNSPELYEIWQKVHSQARVIGKKTPALVNAQVVDWAKDQGHYSKVKGMVQAFLSKEKLARDGVKQLSLQPPRASELYERVDPKADIVDVGVGDGKRLVRFTGYFGNVKGYDIVRKKMVPEWPVNWIVESKLILTESTICTSFLVYAQLDFHTCQRVENCDGMHVVPYHPELRKLGVVKDLENNMVECRMGESVFVERDLGDVQGERLRSFYVGINTYFEREISLKPEAKSIFDPVMCKYFVRMRRDLFVDDFSPKYDGVFMELRVQSGKFIMKDSIGRGVWGRVEAPDMILNLEMLVDRMVLLRVEKYRSFRPYHSLGMLEKFCARVRIKFNGKRVLPPERIKDLRKWREEFPTADGVVCRYGGMDYVMNCGIHLDLKLELEKDLVNFLQTKLGVKTVVHKGCRRAGAIHQVCVQVRDDGSAVCEWRERKDKNTIDVPASWSKKFKLLSIEKYLLKFERKKCQGGMVWDENDGTDD